MKNILYIGCSSLIWTNQISKFKSKNFENYLIAEETFDLENLSDFKKVIIFPNDFKFKYDFIDERTNKNIIDLYNRNIYSYNDCLSRLLFNYESSSYHYRSHFILDLVYYIYNLIKNYKFYKVIAVSPVHRLYDIIIRDICELEKIDFYYPEYAYLGDHGNFINHIKKKKLPNNFKINKKISNSVQNSINDIRSYKSKIKINLSKSNSKIYTRLKNFFIKKYTYPLVIKKNYNVETLSRLLRIILNSLNSSKRLKALKYYKNNCINIKKVRHKFIYFSAISNPERTSNPDGLNFCNNLFALQLLEKYVPKNVYIVYKEHPRSFSSINKHSNHINIKYLKEIKKIPKVLFVDINVDINYLIDNSEFVSAINGSIGIKTIIRGKRFLHFGTSFYKEFPGITNIEKFVSENKLSKFQKTNLKQIFKRISNLPLLRYYWMYNKEIRNTNLQTNFNLKILEGIINNFLKRIYS